MDKVLVTRNIPGAALEDLKRVYTVAVYEGEGKISRAELLARVAGMTAIVSMLTEKMDGEVFEAAGPSLKAVANYAVGWDNVDIAEATRRGIAVTNTPGALGDAVAEFAVALMLALSRRIVPADRFMRAGKYKGWDPNLFLGTDLTGATLGIVGPGTIGAVVGKRAQAVFDMKVIYYCRHRSEEFEQVTAGKLVSLEELLSQADVVSLHVPLTEETRHMISFKELALMKPTAILINTARGPIIEEKALRQALEEKRIWGAALDVYEEEIPAEQAHLEAEDWRSLKDMDQVILTPRIASATVLAREEMTRLAVANIMAALSGKKPENLVNPEVWDKKGGE